MMTIRQQFLKYVYPLFLKLSYKQSFIITNNLVYKPQASFYNLNVKLADGSFINFDSLKKKKVLIVNTASDCGYTPQYDALQKLNEAFKNKLQIIAFPSNDFKQQEKRDEKEIMRFCKINYGVDFPLSKKSVVIKNNLQHPVFAWLSTKTLNGWYDKQPVWNFTKYLVDENGVLTHVFGPAVNPLSKPFIKAVKN